MENKKELHITITKENKLLVSLIDSEQKEKIIQLPNSNKQNYSITLSFVGDIINVGEENDNSISFSI